MKHTLTALLLIISLSCLSQKKDTINLPIDTTEFITLSDINQVLISLSENTTKKQWDILQQYSQLIVSQAINRRKKKK